MPLATLGKLISLVGGIISIWIHLEIRIAEINVELANVKQDMINHRADNRREVESLHNDMNINTRDILRKIDEIQIYLRDNKE